MSNSLFSYFTDPVLQAPTIGSVLMCLSSALIGVIVFLRRRSLLGEALSHASYPGVVLSVALAALFFPAAYTSLSFIVLGGALCTSLIGLWLIGKMEERFRVKQDAALCFVLSFFFGVGVLIASRLQFSHALWYKTAQLFLYGQAATMTDVHIYLYAGLSVLILCVLLVLYHPLRIAIFDREYARMTGLPAPFIDGVLFFLLVLAICIGIRSVGVVLMAGMLIAPAIAARQFSHRLRDVFIWAALFGALSGFFGNYLSVQIPEWLQEAGKPLSFSLPTGPMILLCAGALCLFAFLFSPQSGFVRRLLRAAYFQRECHRENLLKYLWKKGEGGLCSTQELNQVVGFSAWRLFWMLALLKRQGWVEKKGKEYALTRDGWQRATHIVRLHRLWEVYLVHLGQGVEKVHRSAEEMEHIITPEWEQELTLLLDNPKRDPHDQPIPSKESML